MAAHILVDDVVSTSTTPIISQAFTPKDGATTSTYLVFAHAVAGTAVVEVDMGGGDGFVPYLQADVEAGTAVALISEVPGLPHQVRFTPAAATSSRVRILAASAGVFQTGAL